MNAFFRTFTRVRNLMLDPVKEWKVIAEEDNQRKTIFKRFVFPLLSLIAVAVIAGTWLNTSRELYSAGYVFSRIAILWASLSFGLFLSAYIITEIMAQQVESRNQNLAFALIAYASGAAYLVIIIVSLFPFFSELLVLAFYSCYLFWRGIPYLIKVQGQKLMIYALLSFIIIALIHFLLFFFFGNILGALFV